MIWAPNDGKLSVRGGWRGPCTVEATRRPEAGAVTAGAVRWSVWLGVAVETENVFINREPADEPDLELACGV